jgi:hypothetical protein
MSVSLFIWQSCGANEWIRTTDLRFTKPLLYRLSYVGSMAMSSHFWLLDCRQLSRLTTVLTTTRLHS